VSEIIDQAVTGNGPAQACGSFWRAAGASSAKVRADAAVLWEGIAGASVVGALTGPRGLPHPSFASAVVRIAREMGQGSDAVKAALAQAATVSSIIIDQAGAAPLVAGRAIDFRVPLLAVEVDEVRSAWARLLAQGSCTILADTEGNLRPGAMRSLARLLRMLRQREIFLILPNAEDLLRELSAKTIGRHAPPRA
jgi:hypothetical protein